MSLSLNPKHLSTYKDVVSLFLKYGRNTDLRESDLAATFQAEGEVEPSEDAEEFAKDLERLGPTFVKLGQLLSTRADLLPASWMVALQKLQDDVDPFPYEQVQEIIESELGARISKVFESFDEKPLAAASLGQVHRAVLRDSGKEVVVKIQRPTARETVVNDLEALGEVAEFLGKHTDFGRKYEPGRMAKQFRRSILRELDYLEEAANLEKLRGNLSGLRDIVIPQPYRDYCSSKVLTMDFVKGQKITNLSGVVHTELDGAGLAEALFGAYLKQVLIDGFFHADPHPGNLLLTPGRQIALLDLGMTGTVSNRLQDHILQLLSAVSEGNSTKAAEITLRIGEPKEGFDKAGCLAAVARVVESRQGADIESLQVGQLVMEVTEACGSNGLQIPDAMFMLGKMLLNLDLISKELDPSFSPDASIRKHASAIAQQRMTEQLTSGNVVQMLAEVKELFSETPARLNDFMAAVSSNSVRLKVDTVDEKLLLAGFHRVANRIATGLIISALIIGAAMLMNIESSFTLFGYPGLAIILFLAAALAGGALVLSILMSDAQPK